VDAHAKLAQQSRLCAKLSIAECRGRDCQFDRKWGVRERRSSIFYARLSSVADGFVVGSSEAWSRGTPLPNCRVYVSRFPPGSLFKIRNVVYATLRCEEREVLLQISSRRDIFVTISGGSDVGIRIKIWFLQQFTKRNEPKWSFDFRFDARQSQISRDLVRSDRLNSTPRRKI